MTLQPGTRLGPYEIQSALGAGGMGEVYRARDTRLDRTVAIKVLPESLAADPQFRERFDREARVISSLSHPHICTLFDIGHQDPSTGSGPAVDFLVMEYLDGETLADRIARAGGGGGPKGPPLHLEDALQIAIQIAGALDTAHRAGIVHRDLKPGNIMLIGRGGPSVARDDAPSIVPNVRRGGPERGPHRARLRGGVQDPPMAKLLDFGLAKVSTPAVAVAGSMAPTTPPNMTAQGTILGTFQYMAPEQIEGLEADARTDIFAFGAVLFEMLTGRPAFEGRTRASLLGAILKDEPPAISSVRPGTPAALDRIVATCLAKEPDDRWQTARDLLRELKWVADGTSAETGPAIIATTESAGSRAFGLRRRALPWAVAGVLGVTLAVVLAMWAPWQEVPPAPPMRFAIVPPLAQPLNLGQPDRQLAISPDGTRLAYVASVRSAAGQTLSTQLMVRALDRLEAEPLRGISNARSPFFSLDGKWVGFFVDGAGELKKVSTTGGTPITLCRIEGGPRGASWGPDDTVVFATGNTATGLMSVAAGGGDPRVLTKPDAAQNEADHVFPSVLPSGRAVLFTITAPGGIDNAQVAVLDLETLQRKTLIRGGSNAEYVETGHLVYASARTLFAVRFDPVRLEVLSEPVPIVAEVAMAEGAAEYSVSRIGTLVYAPAGSARVTAMRSLVWVTRQGREEPVNASPRAYYTLRLSPDGTRAAVEIRDQESDIWVLDFARQTLTRLTFDPTGDIFPVWTPDGRRIVFRREGDNALFWRPADGTGTDERLTAGGPVPMSFSPDGKSLVVREQDNLALLPMDGKGQTTPLVQTAFYEGLGEISPDGRWLAYQSNESGQDQIYVRPFPDVNSGRSQVSPGGGTKPVWARDGRELFYFDVGGALTTVPIVSGQAFSAGNPTKLFDTRYFSAVNARSYDVSPDGQRFLMIKDMPTTDGEASAAPASIVVVLNWLEELKARLP